MDRKFLDSDADVVHREGNYRVTTGSTTLDSEAVKLKRWDLNYREAAIYLQEGENNDKFTAHPRNQVDLPAYMITHNIWFHWLMLLASIFILLLALVEPPAIDKVSLPISCHAALEIVGLLILTIELVLKVKWVGFHAVLRHVRTMIKAVILIVMFAEAVTIIIRQTSHIRVTRALRPVFLLDSYLCRGVRRFIRQILQALPPIIDMLVLLLFFVLLFSTLGFYLFNKIPNDTYFQSIIQSFISLFILLTTANYPDVMMPAYKTNRLSAIFFIIYISLELFLFMNLFLAVVYSAFIKIEKEKLKKLLLHRRAACCSAFQLLVSGQSPDAISARHFAGCMKYFRPRMGRLNVYLVFKHLNTTKTGKLSLEEFMQVYENVSLKWKEQQKADELWSSNFREPFDRIFSALHRFVSYRWFDYFVYVIIFANFIWILVDTARISFAKTSSTDYNFFEDEEQFLWISITFVVIYVLEATVKILGLGPKQYFASGWNTFDFVVTTVALMGLLLQFAEKGFYYIVLLRPLRVLRLFKLKRRFRDVFGTLFILLSRMLSLAVVMLLLFYFFAIIGMETFASYSNKLLNCCRNTSVESYYMFDNVTGLVVDGYYYLNTFENILISGVTLFELTVVNNWWIIMEGFANVVSPWSRIYFMVFYLIIMIVMTTVVAFILEAFLFRIQYRQTMQGQDMDDHSIKKVFVMLLPDEVQLCQNESVFLTGRHISQQKDMDVVSPGSSPDTLTCSWFRGEKILGKNDFSLKMYSLEVEEWIEQDNQRSNHQLEVQLQVIPVDDNSMLIV